MSICNGRLNFSNLLESSIRLDSSCFGETAREISFFQCWHFPFFARSYLVQCSFVYLLFDHVAVVACARVLQVQGFFSICFTLMTSFESHVISHDDCFVRVTSITIGE